MRQEGEYRVDPELEAMERKCTAELDRMLATSPTCSGLSTPGRSTPGRSPLRQSLNGPLGRASRRSPSSSPLAKSADFTTQDLRREGQ